MPSKALMGTWIALDIMLLAAGAISVAFSIIWRAPNLVLNLVISSNDLTAGLILGILLLVTWVISVGAIVQANHVTLGLKILNVVLIADAVALTSVGSFIWFFTLRERANFMKVFYEQSTAVQGQLQDHFSCCMYMNNVTDPFVQSNFCTSDAFARNSTMCVGPITAAADYTLNNVFTSIYGFGAIVSALFITSLCVINMRMEEVRFKKIDAKRGRAFV
jgi:hypothetical protein